MDAIMDAVIVARPTHGGAPCAFGRASASQPRAALALALSMAVASMTFVGGCQDYELAFQPDVDRQGVHLRFTVTQPSKADILFVVDNSASMAQEQSALQRSFDQLLAVFADQDTRYRIGITSTDAHGFPADCNAVAPPVVATDPLLPPHGALGNCARPEVVLRRPHDGARGRLVAAFDPAVFDVTTFPPELQAAAAAVLPTSAIDGPTDLTGARGARWVIDRQLIRAEACAACAVATCDSDDPLFVSCAQPLTQALVKAYFRANIQGLGTGGFGWEEGIKAALWAVGIDPEEPGDTAALAPGYDLTAATAPNRFASFPDGVAPGGVATPEVGSWVRDDALLAIMFVTDEEDCSMPASLMTLRDLYEDAQGLPPGSMCYQTAARGGFLDTARMAELAVAKKDGSRSRIAVGVIGGLTKKGNAGTESGTDAGTEAARDATPSDCLSVDAPALDTDCTCLQGALDVSSGLPDDRWCTLLNNLSAPLDPVRRCDALAGERYVDFARRFARRSFESICRADVDSFGPALDDFARLATLACFDLQGVAPAGGDADLIRVKRAARGLVDAAPTELARTADASLEDGWYYDDTANKVCLSGRLDRMIGDVYDIFILHTSRVDHTR